MKKKLYIQPSVVELQLTTDRLMGTEFLSNPATPGGVEAPARMIRGLKYL